MECGPLRPALSTQSTGKIRALSARPLPAPKILPATSVSLASSRGNTQIERKGHGCIPPISEKLICPSGGALDTAPVLRVFLIERKGHARLARCFEKETQVTAEQAFEDYHKAVYRFVYRLTGKAELAEDITQDCFLVILREPQRWDSTRAGMKTYLFSIARNLTFKRYRDEHPDLQVDPERALSVKDCRMDQELSLVVTQMVSQLPDLQREALILFEYEGFQLSEISQIVKADIGVVKSRLHRARERLKRMLAPHRKVETHETV